jgi:DNA-binding transcriptional ArsR family regulator
MTTQTNEQLTGLFKALMHPVRLEILDILRAGEECVCHMEAHLGYRQAYISQHLTVLREAGLVLDRRDGWNIYYRVIEPRVFTLVDLARMMAGMSTAITPRPRSAACPCPKCTSARTMVPMSAITVAD